MKNLKLLNKKNLSIIFLLLVFGFGSQAQEPVDIWNVESKQKIEEITVNEDLEKQQVKQNDIYQMQSKKKDEFNIEEDQTLNSKK